MTKFEPIGTGVAIITPFLPNEAIDETALRSMINHVIEGGVEYIVSLGTTGEAVTMSSDECRKAFDITLQEVDNRVPVVAGMFGGNDTRVLQKRLKEYDLSGFSAIMSSSPAYNKPPQQGIYEHYLSK